MSDRAMTTLRQRDLLEAWADGFMWGVLYRAALFTVETGESMGEAPSLHELRGAGAERYSNVLQTVASWRKGGCWALVLWEQSDNFGGGVYFSVEDMT